MVKNSVKESIPAKYLGGYSEDGNIAISEMNSEELLIFITAYYNNATSRSLKGLLNSSSKVIAALEGYGEVMYALDRLYAKGYQSKLKRTVYYSTLLPIFSDSDIKHLAFRRG